MSKNTTANLSKDQQFLLNLFATMIVVNLMWTLYDDYVNRQKKLRK